MKIYYDNLKVGDIIFQLSPDKPWIGHICVCIKVGNSPQKIRVIHATENSEYFGTSKTRLRQTPFKNGMQYQIVRCLNSNILDQFAQILNEMATFKGFFSRKQYVELEKLNDETCLKSYHDATQAAFLHPNNVTLLFNYFTSIERQFLNNMLNPFDMHGFTCSSFIMLCLQLAFLKNHSLIHSDLEYIPPPLKIAFEMATPRLLFHVLTLPAMQSMFEYISELEIPYTLTPCHENRLGQERYFQQELVFQKRKSLLFHWNNHKLEYTLAKLWNQKNMIEHSPYPQYLEKMHPASLNGKTIGYFIGSFDPVHLGHQELVETILKQGLCDYVFVYPVPGGDSYKNRIDQADRITMLQLTFAHHDRVILSTMSPIQLQQYTKQNLGDSTFLGVIGVDVVDTLIADEKKNSVFMRGMPIPQKHEETTVGAIMAVSVKAFIVSKRNRDNLMDLNGYVNDRPIIAAIALQHYATLSSTKVKENIRSLQPIHEMVNPSVRQKILAEHLYREKAIGVQKPNA